VTEAERRAALEAIATEIRDCNRCRLHQGRTQAVPGEGHPSTEVVFVGEGPGFNEDRQGRPFVGRAGELLVRHLGSIGWRRDEVFITNVVKCRPPDNRDPEPDEVAACAPYLKRQLEVLDPALIVTLGRHSMARFMPGARISQAHGTVRAAQEETGAPDAMVFAMYHPAAALRSTDVERQSYDDMGRVPQSLEEARRRRAERRSRVEQPVAATPAGDVRDKLLSERVEAVVAVGSAVGSGVKVLAAEAPHVQVAEMPPAEIPAADLPAAEIPASLAVDPEASSDPSDQLPLF
jgi:uracil-DNA glycosylase